MESRRPVRVAFEFVQSLVARPAAVFPLLCPVREREWVEGWNPSFVVSESGIAERDAVFGTPSDAGEAIWYITEHDPEACVVEMIKITPGFLATRLRVELKEADGGDTVRSVREGGAPHEVLCAARVRYAHTALSEKGEDEVRGWNELRWRRFMEGWQDALNTHLLRGLESRS